MAGAKSEDKVSKSSKDKKEKKEKDPERKEKKSKDPDKQKDKSSKSGDSKTRSSKDGSKSSKDKTANGKDKPSKSASSDKLAANPPAKPPRVREPLQPVKPKGNDYLADMDLPSSESSEDEMEHSARRGEEDAPRTHVAISSGREQKKLADRERKLHEKAVRMKEDMLRDDDNVFDVAFEQQGEGGDNTLSATDIKVHNMTVRAKGKLLLENTQVSITAGRRYGLVGPNGKGKSTLLRLLARRQIPVPDTLDVLLVEQEVVGDERSALQAVVAADLELMKLRQEEEELNQHLAAASLEDGDAAKQSADLPADFDQDAASERLNQVYERMQEINAASAEARASKILHGLGFTEVMQKRQTQLFSGGWRMRISLARALYIQPTVLLLDEPTNHLDLRAVLWLEEYLTRWKKTLVVVSHDRDFLNTVTTDIIHLHDLKLHYYRGNFGQFDEMYEQKRREVNKAAEKYEKQMKAAKKSGNKANQDKVVKSTKQAQQRKNKAAGGCADDTAEPSDAPKKWSDYTVHFQFPEPTELAPPLIQLLDVGFQYPGRDDFGLKDLNIGVDMGSRVAIVGPNGAGKTTLMNLLAGDIEPTQGEFRKSHKLRIGRYAQHFVDALDMETNPIEYLMNRYPEAGLKPEQMRAQLGRFGLSGHHHLQPICKLSGGQKARVVFTSISLSNPHILLLDEPTNHLDMQSIDALSEAIQQFEGGVIIISHDSQLLSHVCDDEERSEVWVVDNGEVTRYDGYFEDYKQELMKEIQDELEDDE
jgi:ATP-binding cassette subfamily F protein 1